MSKTVTHRFADGELVNLTIKGARYVDALQSSNGDREYQFDLPGLTEPFWLPAHTAIHVERAAPAEWPPQAADTWAAVPGGMTEEVELLAIGDGGGDAILVSAADLARRYYAYEALEYFGQWRLLRRRGWTPPTDTAPAAPEPERAAFIDGLRALADLLEARPDLPVRYVGDIRWMVNSVAEVDQWADAFGNKTEHSPYPEGNSVHHTAEGVLAGQSMHVAWVENLPKPIELPHRLPADTRLSLDEALADAESLGLIGATS